MGGTAFERVCAASLALCFPRLCVFEARELPTYSLEGSAPPGPSLVSMGLFFSGGCGAKCHVADGVHLRQSAVPQSPGGVILKQVLS